MKIAIIDADSVAYILSWTNKESDDAELLKLQVDQLMSTICSEVRATHQLTCLSTRSFRHDVYKYRRYKGTRTLEKEPWYQKWAPVITKQLEDKWEARRCVGLEADDLVSFAAEYYGNQKHDCVICSPDKDLNQIPGEHFDFSKGARVIISNSLAELCFWTQMLMGDSGDNIAGVPGIGKARAKEYLVDAITGKQKDYIEMQLAVEAAYTKYYDQYYGQRIFSETRMAVELLCKSHMMYDEFKPDAEEIIQDPAPYQSDSNVNPELVRALGWTTP